MLQGNRYRIPKAEHGSQAWLNQRYQNENGERRISASAAAAIYGQHPFVKADQYAAELLSGIAPIPTEPTWAMKRGNYLEPVVMEMASDAMKIPFTTPDELFCFDSVHGARMIATLDGWHEPTRHILEIKTTTRHWTGELPFYWRIQGIHQAACADADRVTWAVFDPSMELILHEQTIETDELIDHVTSVAHWLNHIDMGIDPPGISYTYETIATKYADSQPSAIELDEEAVNDFEQLRHVKAQRKDYEDLEDQIKARLCARLGSAQVGLINGEAMVTWKPRPRKFFDAKRFQLDNPELASQYMRETTSRFLNLKGER